MSKREERGKGEGRGHECNVPSRDRLRGHLNALWSYAALLKDFRSCRTPSTCSRQKPERCHCPRRIERQYAEASMEALETVMRTGGSLMADKQTLCEDLRVLAVITHNEHMCRLVNDK